MGQRGDLVEKIFDMVEQDHSFDKTNLEFLNAIELNQRKIIELLKDYPAATQNLSNGLASSIKEISISLTRDVQKILDGFKNIPKPDNKIDFAEVVQPILSLQNTFVMSLNKLMSEVTKYNAQMLKANEDILTALRKPKKWKMTPDRNKRTQLIEEVTIEQIGD